MDYVGGASGAALGYILGNIPGAYLGYYAGKKLTQKKMARMRTPTTGSSGRTAMHRLGSASSSKIHKKYGTPRKKYPGRRLSFAGRGTVVNKKGKFVPSTLRRPSIKRKRNKRLRQRRGRRLRISRKFAKKVKLVVDGMHPRAFTIHTFFDFWNGQPQTNQIASNNVPSELVTYGITPGLANQGTAGLLFTPSWFLQQASLAWNNYTPPNYLAGVWQSGQVVNPTAAGMLPWRGTKFPVIKSWARYCLRNNSQRTLYVNVYNCKPKFRGPVVNEYGRTQDAINDWRNACISSSYSDVGNNLTTTTQFINPDTTGSSTNGWLTNINTYKEDPRHNPWFSSRWACEVTKLVLEPGQCTPVIIKGPSAKELDFNKYGVPQQGQAGAPGIGATQDLNLYDIQGFSRSVFFTWHHEMCSYQSSGQWRNGIPPSTELASTGEGFLVETSVYTKVGMPDNILRTQESTYQASATIVANQRIDKYGNFVYAWGASDGTAATAIVNTAGVTSVHSG